MPVRNYVVGGDNAAPFSWEVPPVGPLVIQAVSALWDGAAAAGDFRPALDVFNASGFLVARVVAAETVAAGDSAEVSIGPFLDAAAASAAAGGSSPYATSPQVIPIFAAEAGPFYGLSWTTVRVDNAVRSNAVYTNQSGFHTAAQDDYFSRLVTVGPKGSIWGVVVAYKEQPAGGKFKLALGSLESPDPNRPGSSEGTLIDTEPAWVEFPDEADTYAPVAGDGFHNGTLIQFRVLGDDGAPITAIQGGGDPYTGFDTIDGGAGAYLLRVRCSGKNGASAGFRCELTYLAFLRLTDAGTI